MTYRRPPERRDTVNPLLWFALVALMIAGGALAWLAVTLWFEMG